MIIRILLLAALVWVAWRLVRHFRSSLGAVRPPQTPPEQFEPMARCANCGTYLPAKSLSDDGLCGRCKA